MLTSMFCMKRISRQALLALCASALLFAAACSGQGRLDAAAEGLLMSLAKRNYDAFRKVASKALTQAVSKARFEALANALHRLGELQTRYCEHAGARPGGGYKGRYALHFAKGAVSFEITIAGEKVRAFRMEGPELRRSLKLERAGLLIEELQLTDIKGQPKRRFREGEPVGVLVRLAGLQRDPQGRIDVRLAVRVFREGAAVLNNRHLAGKRAVVRRDPVRLRGLLRLREGRYRLIFSAIDQQRRRAARQGLSVTVDPKGGARPTPPKATVRRKAPRGAKSGAPGAKRNGPRSTKRRAVRSGATGT